jgi:hypothetical protein
MPTEFQQTRMKHLRSLSNAKGAAIRSANDARVKLVLDMKLGNREATLDEITEIARLDKVAFDADTAWMSA